MHDDRGYTIPVGGGDQFGQGKIRIAEINRQLTAVCEIECR